MDVSQPVARTAFYCCVIRADDATAAAPICGDRFAHRFLDDTIRQDIAPLLQFRWPLESNVVRHRLIDDIVRERLATAPQTRVILLGAGFDTRAYRLDGGRWFELDDPQLLALKERCLPAAESPNPLTRVPVVFEDQEPSRYLRPLAGSDDVLVIFEGVSMYLTNEAIRSVASAVAGAFPRATLICDLMSPTFTRTFSRPIGRVLRRMGASFGQPTRHPAQTIEGAGFVARRHISIPKAAMEATGKMPPAWVLATVLRGLRDGYMVWEFTPKRP
jgi:methyltransferase (TIGR00027 family)